MRLARCVLVSGAHKIRVACNPTGFFDITY